MSGFQPLYADIYKTRYDHALMSSVLSRTFLCSQSGNHPWEDVEKVGNIPMKQCLFFFSFCEL